MAAFHAFIRHLQRDPFNGLLKMRLKMFPEFGRIFSGDLFGLEWLYVNVKVRDTDEVQISQTFSVRKENTQTQFNVTEISN